MRRLRGFLDKHLFKVAASLWAISVCLMPPMAIFSDAYLGFMIFPLLLGCISTVVLAAMSHEGAAKVLRLFMFLFVVSVVFKYLQWPGAGPVLVLSFLVPVLVILIRLFTIPFHFRDNPFLVSVGTVASIVLLGFYWASMSKLQHWPGADLIFSYAAPIYLAVTVLILVGIQITDFVKWPSVHRRFLINNILLPWAFMFLVGSTLILFPQYYFDLTAPQQNWGMVDYELKGN